MKRKIVIIVLLALLLNIRAYAMDKIEAKAAVLMELNTGRVLYAINQDEILPQASITKLMTYYVFKDFMQKNSINENEVIVTHKWVLPEDASKANLKNGDKATIDQLLNTLLVFSANDSALQLQDIYDGQNGNMLDSMNRKALEIGMKNTLYINVTGLRDETRNIFENHTTAYETALLAASLIKNYPEVLNITSKKEYKFKAHKYTSTNRLLYIKPGVDGLKTGHTDEAGYCLVATENVSVKGKNQKPFRLIAVVLGSETDSQRFKDGNTLLKYGENNFVNEKVIDKNTSFRLKNDFFKVGYLDASTQEDVYFFKGKDEKIEKKVEFNENLTKDIKKGEEIGRITIRNLNNGNTIQRKLYAVSDYKAVSLYKKIIIYIKRILKLMSR